jgi:hypothetical protein
MADRRLQMIAAIRLQMVMVDGCLMPTMMGD